MDMYPEDFVKVIGHKYKEKKYRMHHFTKDFVTLVF
jgi:hypothetical protein